MRGLISFGIAGALAPELRTGDLIIADTVMNDIGEIWRTHEPWVETLVRAIEEGDGRGALDAGDEPERTREALRPWGPIGWARAVAAAGMIGVLLLGRLTARRG